MTRVALVLVPLMLLGLPAHAQGGATRSPVEEAADLRRQSDARVEELARVREELARVRADAERLGSTEAQASERRSALTIVVSLVVAFCLGTGLILLLLANSVRRIFWQGARESGPEAWRNYLMQLPLGVPEGSVRALLSIFVIVFGLLVLVLQKQIGVNNVEAISGFVGIVITFYFTARTGEQTQKAIDAANKATSEANDTVKQVAADTRLQSANIQSSVETIVRNALPAMPPAQPAPPASAPDPGPGLNQDILRGLQDRLNQVRSVATTAASLGVGVDVLPDAAGTADAASRLLGAVEPLLSGKPDPAAVAKAIEAVGSALPGLEDAGLPGALADALAGLQGLAGVAGPIVAGIPGGPVGIAAGVVLGGIRLAKDIQQFQAFKTAMLSRPFDPVLLPAIAVDGNTATVALEYAPHMRAILGPDGDAAATDVLRQVLARTGTGELAPTAEVAQRMMDNGLDQDGSVLKLDNRVASVDELAEALDEYRAGAFFNEARGRLPNIVPVPATAGRPGATVNLQAVADAAQAFNRLPAGQAILERLVYLAEALSKLPDGEDVTLAFAAKAIDAAAGLAAQRVTVPETVAKAAA